MSKHTPGPWRLLEREVLEDDSVNPRRIVGCDDAPVALMEAPCVAELAVKKPGSLWDTHPQKEANARLIAAAPELLEALQNAVMLLKDTDAEWIAMNASASLGLGDYLRAAISKATGDAA